MGILVGIERRSGEAAGYNEGENSEGLTNRKEVFGRNWESGKAGNESKIKLN